MVLKLGSSLLYNREDGKQGFVHDSFRDFFVAKKNCELVRTAKDISAGVAEVYTAILEKSQCNDSYLWIDGENVEKSVRPVANFLDEMLNQVILHPLFEEMTNDEFLRDNVTFSGFYSAGKSSKVVIHFNEMTQNYNSIAQYLIDLYSHFANKYNINLFLTSGSGFELDPTLINFFPDDPEKNTKVLQKLMEESFICPLEIFLLNFNGRCKGVGVEESDNLKELAKIEAKKLANEEYDSSELVKVYTARSLLLAKKSIKRLSEYNQNIAFLSHFYNGTLGKMNPYHFLARGVSYALIEPKIKPEFDFELYRKNMLRYRVK